MSELTTVVHGSTVDLVGDGERIDAKVTTRVDAADGVVLLTLESMAGTPLPAWQPGAHIDVHLGGDVVRQYSLCGDPADRHAYTIGVLREPDGRGGSLYVHESLYVGDQLVIGAPRNRFELVDAPSYLFIAGGIGITPIAAMLRSAHRAGKPWRLIYGGRTESSMALRDELSAFGDRVTLWPQDIHGLIDLPTVLATDDGTAIYACGPEPLLVAIETVCSTTGRSDALHLERFAPKVIGDTVDTAFEIELAHTGRVITVSADVSVLDVLADAGVHLLSSCREGTCGTCETPVLAGDVDHRDSVLTKEEQEANDCMMVCVSRSHCARLVLDV